MTSVSNYIGFNNKLKLPLTGTSISLNFGPMISAGSDAFLVTIYCADQLTTYGSVMVFNVGPSPANLVVQALFTPGSGVSFTSTSGSTITVGYPTATVNSSISIIAM